METAIDVGLALSPGKKLSSSGHKAYPDCISRSFLEDWVIRLAAAVSHKHCLTTGLILIMLALTCTDHSGKERAQNVVKGKCLSQSADFTLPAEKPL